MLKIIKVKENRNGALSITCAVKKEQLYTYLKSLYKVSKGSSKLVKRFVIEAIHAYVEKNGK